MRKAQLFFVVALAVALYTATTVSPAGAARKAAPSLANRVASCLPAMRGDSLFSSTAG